ncbi:MAG: nicotinate-nucleotide--dimethylbenzimidazole phosphoribosyltransferase [Thiohalocapsa sp.]|jgi:nicotinate-nucleotide--dimethylbenzimidazole phosphoribosyltransferase
MSPRDWFRDPAARPDLAAGKAAAAHQAQLTKPPGALGRLEALAVRLAALQGRERPGVDRVWITVFAADHGVAAAGVSAFPQAVTAQMVANMAAGGAAIAVLARQLGARMELVNLGTVAPVAAHPDVRDAVLGPGTSDFTRAPALSDEQLVRALNEGSAAVERAQAQGSELFIGGEMGIGNTTAATAVACALLDRAPAVLAGPGTGLDAAGVARKAAVIERGLVRHAGRLADPAGVLACVGGFEIAALAGAYIACAQRGLPALVDGFISTAAALAATRLCAGAGEWLLFSHRSGEPGHAAMLEALGGVCLLDLGMRLGEGSGAAVAVPLLRLACALHDEMATFAEAGIAAASG